MPPATKKKGKKRDRQKRCSIREKRQTKETCNMRKETCNMRKETCNMRKEICQKRPGKRPPQKREEKDADKKGCRIHGKKNDVGWRSRKEHTDLLKRQTKYSRSLQHAATHCNILQHTTK